MAKLKGFICNVERCNSGKTILEVCALVKGKRTVFIKDNNQITRFSGPSVLRHIFDGQIRAIFGKSEKIIKPKINLSTEEKKKIRQIGPLNLSLNEKKRFSTLQKAGIDYLVLGWLQTDYWKETERGFKKNPKKIIDLPAAIRQQDHILRKYKEKIGSKPGEIQQIMEFHEIISRIHALLIDWKQSGKKQKDQIQYQIAKVVLQLEFCTNFYKTEARDALSNMSTLEDVLGRLNPPAMAASIVPILGLLAERLEQIGAIVPIIALRKELLKFEKQIMEMEKKNALINLKALLRKSDDQILKEKKFIQTRLNQIIHFLHRLHPSPYYEARHLCVNNLSKAKTLLKTGQTPQARYFLKIARHVLANEI